jgi:L-lactate dehydrogenase complex protein LldG
MNRQHAAFLHRIRAALGNTEEEGIAWEQLMPSGQDHARLAAMAVRDRQAQLLLLRQLCDHTLPLGLQVHCCTDLTEAAQCIVALARTAQPEFTADTTVVLHDHPLLRALRLAPLPTDHNIPLYWTEANDPKVRQRTLAAGIGVTVADWGIAESATIVQLTRPGRPRSTSLVPSIHIAVLPLACLVADLAEAQALIRRQAGVDSLVLITGPSKTADIEATMVLGAHGPKAMHLIVVNDLPTALIPGFPVVSEPYSC